MIYMHKILPLLTAPLFIVLCLLVLGVIRKKATYSISGALVLLIFSSPIFSHWAIKQAEKPFVPVDIGSLPKSDFVIVLSGDTDRLEAAIKIFQIDKAGKIIVTGGKRPWDNTEMNDGKRYIDIAKRRGIKQDKIITTGLVQNTEQEVRAIGKMITKDSKLIVVTSAVHMTRAKMLFQKAGFVFAAYPIKFFKGDKISPMTFIPSAKAFFLSSQVYREFQGRAFYAIKHAVN